MKMLHTGDLHFSNNLEKLAETVRTTNFVLDAAKADRPDVIIVAGDTLDEYDGRIRLDSDCARAAISFVERAADIAPVVIIRGTHSHDRESTYLFSHLRGRWPVHVANGVGMVALMTDGDPASTGFVRLEGRIPYPENYCKAVFILVPSMDKAALLGALGGESIQSGNIQFREAVHDLFAGFGLVNRSLSCPSVLVTHGMLTGAVFSTGQMAIGEDLEFGLNDLHAAGCDYVALGHVHKFQQFPGNVVYCGSPGRLNFGEQEDKGFVMVDFEEKTPFVRFIPAPARRFVFGECMEWSGAESIVGEAARIASDCQGAFVRLRYVVPEEERAGVDRDAIRKMLEDAGASAVKIEVQVIPRQRQRAAGISRVDSLREKVIRWGQTTGTDVPDAVLALAGVIECREVEELLSGATAAPVQPDFFLEAA